MGLLPAGIAVEHITLHSPLKLIPCNGFIVASVPGLSRFDLPFAFTIIHGIDGEGLGAFIT